MAIACRDWKMGVPMHTSHGRRPLPVRVRDEDLRPADIPQAGDWDAIWPFAADSYRPKKGRPWLRQGQEAYRHWKRHHSLPETLPLLRAALYYETGRMHFTSQHPSFWDADEFQPYAAALLEGIRHVVAQQPPLPPIYQPTPGVVALAAYQEPEYLSVAVLKRQNGVVPLPGDEDDWIQVQRADGPVPPMIPLRTCTLHPVDWVPNFAEPVQLAVQEGSERLHDNPLQQVEQWMLAVAAAAAPDEDEPIFDVELTWVDGRSYRLPVPVTDDGRADRRAWNTPGISLCVLRYTAYFAGQEDWTTWASLGVRDWERLLARVPPDSRTEAAEIGSGAYEVQGGIWWQEFWRGGPP